MGIDCYSDVLPSDLGCLPLRIALQVTRARASWDILTDPKVHPEAMSPDSPRNASIFTSRSLLTFHDTV